MGLAQWLSVECAIGNGLAAAQKEEAEFIEKQNEEAAFMRIVLCDDDERILGQLKGWLWEYFRENGLSQPDYVSYADGDSLLAAEDRPDAGRADMAFLDVEMPGTSGIHVGARLQSRNPYIKIFIVTCYADYLDEAMKFHVFRYLSKPLDKDRLFRNLKDALYQLSVDTKPVLIEAAGESVTRHADEIVMVEAMGRRVTIRVVDRIYECAQPMRYWEKLLEIGSFYQTHRSFIINMKYVRSFSPTMITLLAPDGREYPAYLARRRYQSFKNAYILYVEAMR